MTSLPQGTVTFLFSDIEGSTQLQRRLDDRYSEVVETHRLLLEAAFTAHGGTVVDRQTESFFCAFTRAKDAVQAAASAQRGLAESVWPDGVEVRVRMGIHAGEPEVAGDRYVGLAVSRAARICAAGHGGQVLLSSSARALLGDDQRAGLRELGRYRLKDFPAPEPISQLVIDGLPTQFPPLRTESKPAGRRRLVLAAAVLAVAGGIAGVLAVTLGGGSGGLASVGPTSVGVIDSKTNHLVGDVPLGYTTRLIAAGEGFVWIANADGSTLTRIDPTTRSSNTFGIQFGTIPTGIAAGEGAVWLGGVSSDGLKLVVLELGPGVANLRHRIVLERRARSIDPAREPVAVALGEGAVWALDAGQGKVWRIDPKTHAVFPFPGGIDASSIAVGLGSVWTGGKSGVTRLDPDTGTTVDFIPVTDVSDSQAISLAVGEGGVWFAGAAQPKLFRISTGPNPSVASTFAVGRGPSGAATGEGGVWVANSGDGTVSRVDPTSGAVKTIRLGASPNGIVAGFGSVWTSPGVPIG